MLQTDFVSLLLLLLLCIALFLFDLCGKVCCAPKKRTLSSYLKHLVLKSEQPKYKENVIKDNLQQAPVISAVMWVCVSTLHWYLAESAAKFQLPSVCYPWPSILFAQLLIRAALCGSSIVCSALCYLLIEVTVHVFQVLRLCLLSYLLGI